MELTLLTNGLKRFIMINSYMNFININNTSKNIVTTLCLTIFFVLSSCEKDLTKANEGKEKNFPSRVIHNANMLQRDSGFVKYKIKTPLYEEYELIDSPYIEMRKGIYIEFFDKKKPNVPGKLWANYAKIDEKKDLYIGKGNVKIINNEGQTFVMQSIFWDRRNRNTYTQDTVYITDTDGSIFVAANGMQAKDDFSEYTFYNTSGSFNKDRGKQKNPTK